MQTRKSNVPPLTHAYKIQWWWWCWPASQNYEITLYYIHSTTYVYIYIYLIVYIRLLIWKIDLEAQRETSSNEMKFAIAQIQMRRDSVKDDVQTENFITEIT